MVGVDDFSARKVVIEPPSERILAEIRGAFSEYPSTSAALAESTAHYIKRHLLSHTTRLEVPPSSLSDNVQSVITFMSHSGPETAYMRVTTGVVLWVVPEIAFRNGRVNWHRVDGFCRDVRDGHTAHWFAYGKGEKVRRDSWLLRAFTRHRERCEAWAWWLTCLADRQVPRMVREDLTALVAPLLPRMLGADLEVINAFVEGLLAAPIAIEPGDLAGLPEWHRPDPTVEALFLRQAMFQAHRAYPFLDYLIEPDWPPTLESAKLSRSGLRPKSTLSPASEQKAGLIVDAIERGHRLAVELPRILECGPWVIRQLVAWCKNQTPPLPLMPTIRRLNQLPPDAMSAAPATLTRMNHLFDLIAMIPPADGEPHGSLTLHLSTALAGVIRNRDVPAIRDLLDDRVIEHMVDYLRFVHRLKRLDEQNLGVTLGPLTHWLGEPDWSEWLRLSRRWHDAEPSAQRLLLRAMPVRAPALDDTASLLAGSPKEESWEKLLNTPLGIDGYDFVELTSARELAEEGAAMRHCVGSYSDQCLHHTSRIFSIRKAGERVATLELALWDDGVPLQIAQAVGRRNKPITRELDRALDDLVQRLLSNSGYLNERVMAAAASAYSCWALTSHTDDDWDPALRPTFMGRDSSLLRLAALNPAQALALFGEAVQIAPGRGTARESLARVVEHAHREAARALEELRQA